MTFLNHGSFGACPAEVLAAQTAWRERMERAPVAFLARDLERHLDDARAALAAFVGASPQDVVFVANATTGVNSVLRALEWRAGDEILTTDHVYNACLNAMRAVERASGVRVRVIEIPFPVAGDDEVFEPILAAVTPRTRLAVLDHVTSPTAMVLPIERLVRELQSRGVDVLVDGAHAPGMLELSLDALGAAYYTGNCHKWLCAPKGSAFLHVRPDRQAAIHPLVVSHGANDPRTNRSRLQLEFDWTGTTDPTAWLAIPAAIDALGCALAGGWPAVRAANHLMVMRGARLVREALGLPAGLPDLMTGSMVSLVLPGVVETPGAAAERAAALAASTLAAGYEVPFIVWPTPYTHPDERPRRLLVRLSAQLYNGLDDYARLAKDLGPLLDSAAGAAE